MEVCLSSQFFIPPPSQLLDTGACGSVLVTVTAGMLSFAGKGTHGSIQWLHILSNHNPERQGDDVRV